MGTLKPGATYVYERNGEEIYSREVGSANRTLVGYQHENKIDSRTSDGRPLIDHIRDDKLWGQIRRAALTDPTLQQALDRVKILYHFSKKEPPPQTLDW
jgi:hypothetical protein